MHLYRLLFIPVIKIYFNRKIKAIFVLMNIKKDTKREI